VRAAGAWRLRGRGSPQRSSPLLSTPMRRAENSMGMAQAVRAQLYRTWVTKERSRALLGDKTTVNDQLCPGHKGGLIRGEIQRAVADVLRGAEPAQGNRAQTPLHGRLRIFMAALQHGGIDGTGMNGITPDLVSGVLDGGDFGKDAYSTFRGVVGLYCWGFSSSSYHVS